MLSALVGHTGFVGGHLARQRRFDACFNSKNIEEIAGRQFDLLVISGMPAAKWIANRDPEADRAALERLWGSVRQAAAARVVVISTVDVYPNANGVDEDTPIDPLLQHAYGKNRLLLEQRAAEHFSHVTCVRLPGLFGQGLKKNAVYDFLHKHETHKIHAGSLFQFYNLDRLWADVATALRAALPLVNFATEPIGVVEVAREVFGSNFHNDPGTAPVHYDMRTKQAEALGGHGGYLYGKDRVLRELRAFVATSLRAAA